MVVERQPVDHLIHRLAPGSELLAIQPAHFQASPQTFRRRVVPAVARATHRRQHAVAQRSDWPCTGAVASGLMDAYLPNTAAFQSEATIQAPSQTRAQREPLSPTDLLATHRFVADSPSGRLVLGPGRCPGLERPPVPALRPVASQSAGPGGAGAPVVPFTAAPRRPCAGPAAVARLCAEVRCRRSTPQSQFRPLKSPRGPSLPPVQDPLHRAWLAGRSGSWATSSA
jgi:hypothetical protein